MRVSIDVLPYDCMGMIMEHATPNDQLKYSLISSGFYAGVMRPPCHYGRWMRARRRDPEMTRPWNPRFTTIVVATETIGRSCPYYINGRSAPHEPKDVRFYECNATMESMGSALNEAAQILQCGVHQAITSYWVRDGGVKQSETAVATILRKLRAHAKRCPPGCPVDLRHYGENTTSAKMNAWFLCTWIGDPSFRFREVPKSLYDDNPQRPRFAIYTHRRWLNISETAENVMVRVYRGWGSTGPRRTMYSII